MNGDDVRMGQTRSGFRFPQETYANFLTERELRREHLYRHRALEPLIAGMIDHTHAAAADFPVERVGRA